MERDQLLDYLENQTQVFKNTAVKDAFHAIDRKDFVQPDYEIEAYEDYAVPTLDGQVILKPTVVAFMLELLDAQKDDSVLDIGSGSGWSTALLGHMVGEGGSVLGLEISPALLEHSNENISKYKNLPIDIIQADAETGYYRNAPYNRIISSAAFENKDEAVAQLLLQLTPGGVMVVPVGDSIVKIERISEDEIEETEYPGFSFAPYIPPNLES